MIIPRETEYREDCTKKRSEVDLTGRYRLRGTFIVRTFEKSLMTDPIVVSSCKIFKRSTTRSCVTRSMESFSSTSKACNARKLIQILFVWNKVNFLATVSRCCFGTCDSSTTTRLPLYVVRTPPS